MENTNVTALKEQLMAKLPPLRPLHEAILDECCEGVVATYKDAATEEIARANYRMLLGLMNALLVATFNAHGEGSLELNYRGQTFHPDAADLATLRQLVEYGGQEIQ